MASGRNRRIGWIDGSRNRWASGSGVGSRGSGVMAEIGWWYVHVVQGLVYNRVESVERRFIIYFSKRSRETQMKMFELSSDLPFARIF